MIVHVQPSEWGYAVKRVGNYIHLDYDKHRFLIKLGKEDKARLRIKGAVAHSVFDMAEIMAGRHLDALKVLAL